MGSIGGEAEADAAAGWLADAVAGFADFATEDIDLRGGEKRER